MIDTKLHRARALLTPQFSYKDRALHRIDARLDADDHDRQARVSRDIILSAQNLWHPRGSAGKAREWFAALAAEHPYDPFAVLSLLEQKVEDEIVAVPRYYSAKHLRDVVQIVREEIGL